MIGRRKSSHHRRLEGVASFLHSARLSSAYCFSEVVVFLCGKVTSCCRRNTRSPLQHSRRILQNQSSRKQKISARKKYLQRHPLQNRRLPLPRRSKFPQSRRMRQWV